MDYIELKLEITPSDPWIDLMISDLGDIEFESFSDEGNELKAYISENLFDQGKVNALIESYKNNCDIASSTDKIEFINWNKEWEKNFDPIIVDDTIVIKSSFHSIPKQYEYEILIDPKMSFGTGHHATTYLMMQKMLELDFQENDVLDMGSGTGVLAILAKKKGAKKVVAIDINDWAYENSLENVKINQLEIKIEQGGSELLGNQQFNIILANINLNVLLADMELYKSALVSNGNMVFSGVLEQDKDKLKDKAKEIGLVFVEEKKRDNWMMFHFKKN